MKNYRKIPDLHAVLEPLRIVLPTVTYSDLGFQLEIEGTNFIFAHPPTGAHTLGDTYLCLSKKRVLFAGDIMWNRFYPNLEDANLEGWIDTLNDLDFSTYSQFLPGHGEICGGKQVAEFLNYLISVRDNLAELESRGKTNDFQAQISCFEVPGTENWLLGSIIDYNINALFHAKE
jgi:glyoxylase-like metal-dependent hydrolase (beta-lactamase superfamily II)